MELKAGEVLEVLRNKGVSELHHANTIQTSCNFLQEGRLLSRGTVYERGLTQTPQQTDELDKKYGLWYDIFLDGVDIHYRARRRNLYGPVLFVFDFELLSQNWLSSLWVTKKNPQHWSEEDVASDRYFSTTEELGQHYQFGNFDKMLVLRHIGGVLRLQPYLKKIIVDNPKRSFGEIDVFSQAIEALKTSAAAGSVSNSLIEIRDCREGCNCANEYRNMRSENVKKFFAP